MMRSFEPYDETADPRYGTWVDEDRTDPCIPSIDGYITDFVYATRGREVTSLYAVWSAIFLISSVVQRDAWFTPPDGDPWLDKEFLNLYTLFIGPAGCGKSSAVNVVQKVLSGTMGNLRESEDGILNRKDAVMISNMATPEAFLSTLYAHTRGEEGRKKIIAYDSNNQAQIINATANGVGLVSEFASLLGKQNYQSGMNTALLELYDCPFAYRWNTVKRGYLNIPEVFFNMLGASTADGISSSVNPAVLEDGFMSRTIMAYVPGFPRRRAFRFQTNCSTRELVTRLTWIAKSQLGNYSLSKDARMYYEDWYDEFMGKMDKQPERAGYMIRNRSLALKVAVLLKMSDYKPGRVVHREHLQAAFDLIDYTYKEVADLINYFTNARVGAAKKAIIQILTHNSGGATRRNLANKANRYNAEVVDQALIELWLEGKLIVVSEKGDSEYGKKPEGWPAERYAISRTRHRDSGFEPTLDHEEAGDEEELPSVSEVYVPDGDPGDEDSEVDGEESVGDIFSFEVERS